MLYERVWGHYPFIVFVILPSRLGIGLFEKFSIGVTSLVLSLVAGSAASLSKSFRPRCLVHIAVLPLTGEARAGDTASATISS